MFKECGIFEYIKLFFFIFKILECGENGVKNFFLYCIFNLFKEYVKEKYVKKEYVKENVKFLYFFFVGYIDVVLFGDNW